MSEHTAITWCDATFNPWWGCQKVSPACDHCYAERDSKRFAAGKVLWGVGSERRTFADKHWEAPADWAKTMPAKLGRRPRVFCASMGDWLDLDAPITEFVRLLDTISKTPELDWLLLSKRIGNWRKRLEEALPVADWPLGYWIKGWLDGHARPNVWLGATVVNQAEVDRDIPKLLAVPAAKRFLSIEPMLGPVDLGLCDCDHGSVPSPYNQGGVTCMKCGGAGGRMLDWIIVGGESGPQARPMHPDWVRSVRDQCAAADVPLHFKQHGEWMPVGKEPNEAQRLIFQHAKPAARCYSWPNGETMVWVGTAAAGRKLDGIEHNGVPS